LNTAAYYRATLTNNTFGTSTYFQGLTWSISSSGVTSVGPISTSFVSTAGSGNTVTWFAPSPWSTGDQYIWEGRLNALPTFTQVSNITYAGAYRIQTFEVGSYVPAGSVYSLGVYSYTVYYTAAPGDTALDVAIGLVNIVNSTTVLEWDTYGSAPIGNPYFPPTAYHLGGSQLSVELNFANTFSHSLTV
jgi:hypothetical protein